MFHYFPVVRHAFEDALSIHHWLPPGKILRSQDDGEHQGQVDGLEDMTKEWKENEKYQDQSNEREAERFLDNLGGSEKEN